MESGQVQVSYSKWGGIEHWHFAAEHLGRDRFGWWLSGRNGILLQRGSEPPIVWRHDFVLLAPAEGCWTAYFNANGKFEIYADVTTRPVTHGGTLTAVDLDLDVVRHPDGRVEVLDEDEFADHQITLGYPATLVDAARATSDWLVGAMSARAEPFATVGARWLARMTAGR